MDSYIKFIGHSDFQKKIRERKGLSRKQIIAYRDFQQNFARRIGAIEAQVQMPIQKALTKKEIVNIYKASIGEQKQFTPKEFSKITGMNQGTARKELGKGVNRGQLKRVKRGVYEYI